MPTVRNYSPEEVDEDKRKQDEKVYAKQSRNARLPPQPAKSGNSNHGTMRTVALLPGDDLCHHSPHMQSRLLQNFN